MNFFSKIKQNIEHGDVGISLQAAKSVSLQDHVLPITIIIINHAKIVHTIKKVTAKVEATENNTAYGMFVNNTVQRGNTTDNNEMYTMQTLTVGQAANAEQLVLQPNESKTVTLSITVNSTESPNEGIAGYLASITKDVNHYKYELYVSADVEGISLDPHVHQSLQIS